MTRASETRPALAWSGLRAIDALAVRLLGEADGPAALDAWFEGQRARTSDLAFAAPFHDYMNLPGIAAKHYLHRIVEAEGLRVLGGIRFHGGDVARPFVEAIAWDVVDEHRRDRSRDTDTIERLRALVSDEWRAFAPLHVRLQLPEVDADPADERLPSGWTTDVTVHAAEARAMAPDDGTVVLLPFDDPSEAAALVEARYEALRRDEPGLSCNVSPADADTLAECHAAGSLFAMTVDGRTVGLIATLPDAIDWFTGDVVMEEIVLAEHAGHGYAAAAQRALGARYARDEGPRRLIGTIDGLNVASARSAVRAGRRVVARHVFVALHAAGKAT